MQVLILKSQNIKILTTKAQPFLIIKLIGQFFILTKAVQGSSPDKNINFVYEHKQYYSTFSRHVNLTYSGKLSQLLENLDVSKSLGLQHQWLLLYEIHQFQSNQMTKYKVETPLYGSQVLIRSHSNVIHKSKIANGFRFHGDSFYFVSNYSNEPQQFALVINKQQEIIYGITYVVKNVIICLPFNSIGSQKPQNINISAQVKPVLESTCYVRTSSTYCTGIVINKNRIISARHVLSADEQKIGTQVGIRFYPYNEEKAATVSRIGLGNVDLIQIQIASHKQTSYIALQSKKDYKINAAYQQKLVGRQILALGFGKFGYSSRLFNKVELVLPTIQSGIVSKIINIKNIKVFLKTDASLYNGFSGCGIWHNEKLAGMAIFILKNKNNNSNFNKHNFSYLSSFVQRLLDNKNYDIATQINSQLIKFDKIQTRFRINLRPKL